MYKKIGALCCVVLLFFCIPAKAAGGGIALMELSTGSVLFSQNESVRLPMASTTKIMTALVVLEQVSLQDPVVIPAEAVGIEGSSLYLKKGEILTVEQLLYGLMLQSGNDAAVALALFAGNSVEAFVKLMNDKAEKLSLTDTHFENPNGLDGETHYTTALDFAKLTAYALQNDIFRKIVSTKIYKISGTTTCTERTLVNHNRLLSSYEGAIGVKTGFTKKSGRCLVSAVEREGVTLICVTLGVGDDWNVHKKLYDQYFPKCSVVTALETNYVYKAVYVAGCGNVGIYNPNALQYVKVEGAAEGKVVIKAPTMIYAPKRAGDVVGSAQYLSQDGRVLAQTDLVIDRNVSVQQKRFWLSKLIWWFKGIFSLQ